MKGKTMLRKLILTTPVVAMLSLTGCATTGTPSVATVVAQVREAAVAVCGFLPTVATVAAIISANNPAVSGVSAIANAICTAVTSVPLRALATGRQVPVVAGVVVHGKFVR